MTTNQPMDPNITVKALENMIDTYRRQIGLQEESISKNDQIMTSQNYTIGQNENRLKEMGDFIASAESNKKTILEAIQNLNDERDSLLKHTSDSRDQIARLNEEIKTLNDQKDFVSEGIAIMTKESESSMKSISDREKSINEKEESVKSKHDLISKFAQSLK